MLRQVTRTLVVSFVAISATGVGFAQGNGATVFEVKCQMCHGADGLGQTPVGKSMGLKSLTDDDTVKKSDADLIALTKTGKDKMAGFANKLSDEEIKDVVAYIRTLQKK